MKIKAGDFKVDERRSNPMVVAMQVESCPIQSICFAAVVGSGTIAEQCPHLKTEDGNETDAECTYRKA